MILQDLNVILDFVERHNKQDTELYVAEASELLELELKKLVEDFDYLTRKNEYLIKKNKELMEEIKYLEAKIERIRDLL